MQKPFCMTSLQPPRYLALDVLRGMTVCFMIIVNNQGSGATPFGPLEHAEWHGFTPTDLVFPTFLFVVGNAMAFSMHKFESMSDSQVLLKILKRTIIIFLLGYLMYWFPFFHKTAEGAWELSPISHTRILGVLQRIALCYAMAALMIRYLPERAVKVVSIIILLGYWLVLYVGGDYSMTGNFGMPVDKWLLGEDHMYHGEGFAFEPEGVLSTLPSVVNVIIGYYAGIFIRKKGNNEGAVMRLLLAGAVLMTIAYFWHSLFPINKKLWTSSFVLYTCGLDLLILGALIFVIEIRNKRGWTWFFEVFGKNPLFIYLLADLLATILYTITTSNGQTLNRAINLSIFQKLAPGPLGSLLFSLTLMFVCWAVGWWMDKKKIYVRV